METHAHVRTLTGRQGKKEREREKLYRQSTKSVTQVACVRDSERETKRLSERERERVGVVRKSVRCYDSNVICAIFSEPFFIIFISRLLLLQIYPHQPQHRTALGQIFGRNVNQNFSFNTYLEGDILLSYFRHLALSLSLSL